ncbi:MAG: hypothetical protein JWN03_3650 [Nocardia sp.]|nr:hypothetical protein [Nocardia sp.]
MQSEVTLSPVSRNSVVGLVTVPVNDCCGHPELPETRSRIRPLLPRSIRK